MALMKGPGTCGKGRIAILVEQSHTNANNGNLRQLLRDDTLFLVLLGTLEVGISVQSLSFVLSSSFDARLL